MPGGGGGPGLAIGGYEQAMAQQKGDQQRLYAQQLERDQMLKQERPESVPGEGQGPACV